MDQIAGHEAVVASIGPNAVTQLPPALRIAGLERVAEVVFCSAGVGAWLSDPPSEMVDERLVCKLHCAFRTALPGREAERVMREAGRLTAGYLLANRIPGPVQMVMKLLPAPLAARMLVSAIRSHAWTFAGSGRFSARNGRSTVFEISDNPLCRGEWAPAPVCAWHTAVFQRLFEVLVSPNSRAVETHCEANGDPCCRFVIDRGAGGMAG